MSGGVRNLRAMFENKDATSPPERGRSPGESLGASSTGTSPRPLSKVRTSFVTVERSGQIGHQLGLKREDTTSAEPNMTKRRTSFSINEENHPKETAERKQSIAKEMEARKNSSVITETVPEVAVKTPSLEVEKKLELPKSPGAKKEVKSEPAKVDVKKAAATTNGHTNGNAKTAEKAVTSKPVTKPTPISTARTTAVAKASPSPSPNKLRSPALKSPLPKTPTTPKRAQPKESVPGKNAEKEEVKNAEKKPSRNSLQPSHATKPASKPPTTAAHGSVPKTRIPASPPQTGFNKPRPKSPTRPVALPASLTKHTASSGSKTATAPPVSSRQSLSRASGNAQPTSTISRSPSRASATAKSAISRTASQLKSGNSRPSLGPPPSNLKKQTSRQSLPPAPADDSFLARMMRPTTASASKTAEKPPSPKRATSVQRPITRDGPQTHHEPAKAGPTAHKKEHAPVHAPAKTVPKETKTVVKSGPKATAPAKPEVKIASPAKKEESKPTPASPAKVERKEEPAVEIPKVAEVKEVKADIPKVELTEAEEPVKEAEPVQMETKTEGPVIETPTPVEAPKTPAKIEEPAPAASPEKDLSTIMESPAPLPAKEEVTQPVKEVKPVKDTPVEISVPSKSEITISSPLKSPVVEDPEDVKAREEIARLNAELMKGVEVEESA